jgi:hypothetical protein
MFLIGVTVRREDSNCPLNDTQAELEARRIHRYMCWQTSQSIRDGLKEGVIEGEVTQKEERLVCYALLVHCKCAVQRN